MFLVILFVCLLAVISHACPDTCKCTDHVVDCSYRGLRLFPRNGLLNARTLLLHHNQLTDLPYFDSDSPLQYIEVLDLRNNNLTTIPDVTFENLYYLRELRLDYNQLVFDSSNGDALTGTEGSLKILTISHNRLTGSINDYTYSSHHELTQLDLSYNSLTAVDADAFPYFLEQLDLSYNALNDIHLNAFRNVEDLLYLDLRGLALEELSMLIFRNMRALRILKIGGDQLHGIIQSFQDLDSLEKLELSRTIIEELPADFLENCSKLMHVNLTNNRLTTLPPMFFSTVPLLKVLDLSRNNIKNGNVLTEALKDTTLDALDLSGNKIHSSLSDLAALANLQSLNLSDNNLISLNESLASTSLRNLHLSSNYISSVSPHVFTNCTKLRKIDITDNLLSTFPTFSEPTVRDLVVYVDGNPWDCNCDVINAYKATSASDVTNPLVCKESNDLDCVICAKPINVTGTTISDVTSRHLIPCKTTENFPLGGGRAGISRAVLVLIVVILLLILCATGLLVWLRRGQIKSYLKNKDPSSGSHIVHAYRDMQGNGKERNAMYEKGGCKGSTCTLASNISANQFEIPVARNASEYYPNHSNHVNGEFNWAIEIEQTDKSSPPSEHLSSVENVYQVPRLSAPIQNEHYEASVNTANQATGAPHVYPDVTPDNDLSRDSKDLLSFKKNPHYVSLKD